MAHLSFNPRTDLRNPPVSTRTKIDSLQMVPNVHKLVCSGRVLERVCRTEIADARSRMKQRGRNLMIPIWSRSLLRSPHICTYHEVTTDAAKRTDGLSDVSGSAFLRHEDPCRQDHLLITIKTTPVHIGAIRNHIYLLSPVSLRWLRNPPWAVTRPGCSS